LKQEIRLSEKVKGKVRAVDFPALLASKSSITSMSIYPLLITCHRIIANLSHCSTTVLVLVRSPTTFAEYALYQVGK
jgi:hypothetical protein